MELDLLPDVAGRGQTVLVVDDEPPVRAVLQRILESHGYSVVTAADGTSALDAIAAQSPSVVLLDLLMPGIDGFEVCRRVRRDAATRLTPIIVVTGQHARDHRLAAIDVGADDFLTKPVDGQELLVRVRSLARMKEYTDDLDSAAAIITTLATMIETRDGYSQGHCARMANYATRLGRAIGLAEDQIQALYRGGFLHDIGMLAISDSVLRKTGPLTPAEYELIKSHTLVGDALCANLRSLQSVRPIIRWHHERLDGSGYPDGLSGAQIPVIAQVTGVVDAYEALTSDRPYQQAQSHDEALALLREQAARGWRDPAIVETFATVTG
jgi:putative two-component system response regulator